MARKYNSEKHNRRSIRLKGYDYARRGAYFVTICTQKRECLFGKIQHSCVVLNNAGEMVQKVWKELPKKCPGIVIDECIIMPNHIHGIICIVGAPLVGAHARNVRQGEQQTNACARPNDRAGTTPNDRAGTTPNDRAGTTPNDRAGTRPAPTVLGDVVGIFKSISTHQYTINVNDNHWPPFQGKLWQRNYYERIIRNETEMNRIRQYIIGNPAEWENDENNPVKL